MARRLSLEVKPEVVCELSLAARRDENVLQEMPAAGPEAGGAPGHLARVHERKPRPKQVRQGRTQIAAGTKRPGEWCREWKRTIRGRWAK